MTVQELAALYCKQIAHDDSHGYSQRHRWPWEGSDFDCSSLAIYSYIQAGVPLECTYTGNMYDDMLQHDFKDVTRSVNLKTGAGLQIGDIMLRKGHTAEYVGGGNIVECTSDEYGGIEGRNAGDQTGFEIYEHGYYNGGWTVILRYEGGTGFMFTVETLQKGSTGPDVKLWQTVLRGDSIKDDAGKVIVIDGIFGDSTEQATIKFQKKMGLDPDGVVGALTWGKGLYR